MQREAERIAQSRGQSVEQITDYGELAALYREAEGKLQVGRGLARQGLSTSRTRD